MSKRGRGLYIALGLAALVAFGGGTGLVAGYRLQHHQERRDTSEANQQDARVDAKRTCSVRYITPALVDECVSEIVDARQAEQRNEYDLKAQQEMAEWAFAVFLTTFFGLFISGGGLWALVWTFREQRRLTQNASRASLQVERIVIHPSSQGCFWIFFEVRNHGDTSAFDIYAKGELHFSPGINDIGGALDAEARETFVSRELEQIPRGENGELRYLSEDAESFLKLPVDAGRNPYIGTEHSAPPEIFIKGVVAFTDIFEQKRELRFHLKMLEMRPGGDFPFVPLGTGYRGG